MHAPNKRSFELSHRRTSSQTRCSLARRSKEVSARGVRSAPSPRLPGVPLPPSLVSATGLRPMKSHLLPPVKRRVARRAPPLALISHVLVKQSQPLRTSSWHSVHVTPPSSPHPSREGSSQHRLRPHLASDLRRRPRQTYSPKRFKLGFPPCTRRSSRSRCSTRHPFTAVKTVRGSSRLKPIFCNTKLTLRLYKPSNRRVQFPYHYLLMQTTRR